jgi:glycosyltransferase involved in cell wall biosynthesis
MRLVIFANFFPYKKAEPFLVNEFEFSKKYSRQISLFSLYGKPDELQLNKSDTFSTLPPVFESHLNKTTIFFKGIFNLSPFYFHFKESVSQLFSFKKLYWLLVSLLLSRAVMASKAYKELLKSISKDEKTVLYFYWGDNLCWIIPYLKKHTRAQNLKIVIRLHGSDLYENLKWNYAPLRKLIFEHADLIVPISENGKEYLLERYPEVKNKIHLSRLGVFDNGLNPHKPSAKKTIVSVSNLVNLKRVDLIFEVLQKMKGRIEWYHFGDGPLNETIKELAKNKREDLYVHLKGYVTNKQVLEFYKTNSVDLFINLSTTEGLPVSIMEALSFGIPVLAPNIGGIGELVSDLNGKLIPVDLPATDIATELQHLLLSERTADLRKNARFTFETKVSAPTNYTNFYLMLTRL